jgi:hypothetical protein
MASERVGTGVAGRVLRQAGRSQAKARLDSLADSLTSFAIQATDARDGDAAWAAVVTLGSAGATERFGKPIPDGNGSAYAGALERLIRIHREARSESLRDAALIAMVNAGDRPRMLGYLRTVAISRDPTVLSALARPEGNRTLGLGLATALTRAVRTCR